MSKTIDSRPVSCAACGWNGIESDLIGEGDWIDVIMGDTREVAPLPGEGRDGLLVEKDGLYHISHQFVARCFQSSPKKAG